MKQHFVLLCLGFMLFFPLASRGQILWSNTSSGQAWLTTGNWTGGSVPGTTGYAQFGANPTPSTAWVGINMNGTTNNGTQNQAVGAIEMSSSRGSGLPLIFINSSTAAPGVLTLNGTTVSSVSNVILANNSPSAMQFLYSATTPSPGSNKTMRIALSGSSNLNILTAAGGTTTVGSTILIKDTITGSAPITFLGGGTYTGSSGNNGGLLRLGNANTFSGGIIVGATSSTYNSGILQLDTIQSISNVSGNNITINPFSQLYLNAAGGSTFTQGNMTLNLNGYGNGITSTYGPGALRTAGASFTWTGPINIASDASIAVGTAAAHSLTASGNISGSGMLRKDGLGNLVLSGGGNNWSGGTYVTGGLVTIASGSSISNGDLIMGQFSTNTTTVVFNNTSDTISNLRTRWTATTGTIAQSITLNGTVLTINQTIDTVYGAGAVNTLSGIITGTGKIIKIGSGRLTLTSTGSNFSGGLKVSQGEVRFNPTAAYTNTSCADTLDGGAISNVGAGTFGVNLGTLALTNNSTINLEPSSTSQLKFQASSGITWTSGKIISVYGWAGTYGAGTAGTAGRLFIGTSTGGLLSSQLAQIQFVDGSSNRYPATILSTGEIVPGPAVFYSKATGNLDDVTTWGLATDGTGAQPANFSTAYQYFTIANGNSGNIGTSPWTVTGTNSKVIVGASTDLTITASKAIVATVDVTAGRNVTILNSTLPTLGAMDPASTVTYKNGTSNLLSYTQTYGNIVIDGSGTGVTNTAGVVSYAGNITLQNSATFNASSVDLRAVGSNDATITGNGLTLSVGNFNKTRIKPAKLTLAANTPITVNGQVNMFSSSA
ncbi:MAG: hypothetical protein EBZ77_09295, partial [Chitinophagia bacterium]|nr:hypothetical protein [Chitinophagia bacterium]